MATSCPERLLGSSSQYEPQASAAMAPRIAPLALSLNESGCSAASVVLALSNCNFLTSEICADLSKGVAYKPYPSSHYCLKNVVVRVYLCASSACLWIAEI